MSMPNTTTGGSRRTLVYAMKELETARKEEKRRVEQKIPAWLRGQGQGRPDLTPETAIWSP
jgi:hypothetical protein